ncbi:hypothetical protein J6590_000158 [Homalodisca vitripennis]|nr:hypothetical protein J6590_000158 [Homalodisca vitripennis]
MSLKTWKRRADSKIRQTKVRRVISRGGRNRAEILSCVPSLQALEMGKNSLRPYGRYYSNDLTSL